MLSFDGGLTFLHQAHPLHSQDLSIDSSRDLDKGQIFFRDKLSGPLRFHGVDYEAIKTFHTSPTQRCQPIHVRLDLKCNGDWREKWTGMFAASSGTWDFLRCIVEVTPETVDKYTCILAEMKVRQNILRVEALPIGVPVASSLAQFYVCCGFDTCWPPGDQLAPSYAWKILSTHTDHRLFVRYSITTTCAGTVPTQPEGTGWNIEANNCATDGTATFTKPLSDDDLFILSGGISWEPAVFVDGVLQPAPCADAIYSYCPSETFPETDHMWVCNNPVPIPLGTVARSLNEVGNFLVDATNCGMEDMRSDFFEWDPVGDAPGYAPGINYITGIANVYNELCILQKSDAMGASNSARLGEMTLEEFFTAIRTMFRVWWDIDEAGFVRLEHWKYWLGAAPTPLSSFPEVIDPKLLQSMSAEIPKIERATWMEALSRDFVGMDIVYGTPCVSPDQVMDISPGRITTEISLAIQDPAAVSRDGFIIVATIHDGTSYNVMLSHGAITGNYVTNAALSWANLQRDLWTWDRLQPSGTVNGSLTDFDGFLPTAEQKGVRATLGCGVFDLDTKEGFTGYMSAVLGVPGSVGDLSFNLRTCRAEMTLQYPY